MLKLFTVIVICYFGKLENNKSPIFGPATIFWTRDNLPATRDNLPTKRDARRLDYLQSNMKVTNLYDRVTVLRTSSPISSFLPIEKLRKIIWILLLCNKKIQVRDHARLNENEHLFRNQVQLEGNIFCPVRARAHLRANDTKIVRSRDAQCDTDESS